ncbi:MAG: ATP cone domain-containing protein [Candidatus Hermodarchaeia archaeon]|jgi:ribonucleoside-diphosphate reductase alpha chain
MSNYFDIVGTKNYSQFIHLSRYSRWLEEEGRRETWEETTHRYVEFFANRFPKLKDEILDLQKYILNFKVMPSMRCFMTAGKALEKDEIAGYNCSFVNIDNIRAFDEILYVLMCGVGVGFSVERQHVNKLPEIAESFYNSETTIVVPDSKIGWATSFRELISLLYGGKVPKWDLSRLRPAGARLKTFGGRSSGPQPLDNLFRFAVNLFKKAAGRKLNSIECHDLVCKIADIVVVGGVRRSALLSLSNVSDDRMRMAKSGQWWLENKQRRLANNSACYTEKPELEVFMKEWSSLYESKSGERGIFNRISASKQVMKNGRRILGYDWGTNPCSEIILRSCELCNLSEIVARPDDTLEDLKEKAKIATIFGTLQSTLTNFRYLRKIWANNTEEERLLGVSITGIMDHKTLSNPENSHLKRWLTELKDVCIETNKEWAEKLGIEESTAITCVKPSGTVSQLCNTASGIHARHSEYYIRRVRIDRKDPIGEFMRNNGFPNEVDVMNNENYVFEFPIKAPPNSLVSKDVSALKQLEIWKTYQDHWCEHKPSCTVYYTDDEFMAVGAWVWTHFNDISGISFLPYSDHIYDQAPYESVSEEQYKELREKMPSNIDWMKLKEFEEEDNTTGSQTYACSGGSCEVVDLVKKEE